jgi:hypothetical protein
MTYFFDSIPDLLHHPPKPEDGSDKRIPLIPQDRLWSSTLLWLWWFDLTGGPSLVRRLRMRI